MTIASIADPIKVSASLFAALERGDVSRWPKGVFRRAFFRDYIAAMGLPAEPWRSEFLGLFPDDEDGASVCPPPQREEAADLRLTLAGPPLRVWSFSRSQILEALGGLAVVLLPAAAVTWWMDANLWTGAGVIALCYYPRVAGALVSRVKESWRASVKGT